MSLPLDWPVVETGDRLGQLEAWRIDGLSDLNSDRGRLWADVDPAGPDAQVSLFRDRGRGAGDLVAQGTGPLGRISFTEQNGSGLSGSVLVQENTQSATVVLFAALATQRDFEERDDQIKNFLLEDPPELDFRAVYKLTSRAFYTRIKEVYPPPVRSGAPLRASGAVALVEAGSRGLPESAAEALWNLNDEGDWELVGLQDPGDFRDWATLFSLALIWRRKARSGDDGMLERAVVYAREAAQEFERHLPVSVDVDRDLLPERPVKTQTMSFRRG